MGDWAWKGYADVGWGIGREKKEVGAGRTAEGPAPGYGERVSKALVIC